MLAEEFIDGAATPAELTALHAALDRFWAAVDRAVTPPPPQDWRLRFATAALELATNVVQHAYPDGAAPRPMQVRLRAYADRSVARFADRGVPFTGPLGPRAEFEADPLTLPEGGYGLALILACVYRLAYRRTRQTSNCWRLVKRFRTED